MKDSKPSKGDIGHPASDGEQNKPARPPVLASPDQETKKADHRTDGGEDKTPPSPHRLTDRRLQTIFAGLVAFATVLYSVGFIYSLRELRVSREQESRAWVTADSATLDIGKYAAGQPTTDLETQLRMDWANTGRTPARTTKFDLNAEATGSPLQESLPLKIDNASIDKNIIRAGGEARAYATIHVPEVVFKELANESSQIRVYIRGKLTYEDAFGATHYTEFCFFKAVDRTPMKACGDHNAAN